MGLKDRARDNHGTIEDRIWKRVHLGLNEACSLEIKYFIYLINSNCQSDETQSHQLLSQVRNEKHSNTSATIEWWRLTLAITYLDHLVLFHISMDCILDR